MTKLYSISYDFRNPGAERYADFFKELEGFGSWWHYLSGTWLIATELSADVIFARLRPHLDEDVNILIAEVGPDMAGWLPRPAWSWINAKRKEVAAATQFKPSASA